MLRTMREKTKIIMLILAVAFVGWLVFDVGMGVSGRNQGLQTQNLGSVNGKAISYQSWLAVYQQTADQARQRNPGQTLSREDQKALEDDAFEQLVEEHLMQAEFKKRGIVVTDQEILDAARRMPPPEVVNAKDFQTDGRFDVSKWERFLASGTEPDFLAALEAQYRSELPRLELLEQVTSDIYVPDAKLWNIYRDQHDSVTVQALVIRPDAAVADASVQVTQADLDSYYRAHADSLKRPAQAFLSYIGVSKLPGRVDSVVAVERARALRDSLVHGLDFATAAKNESADSGSAANGGLLRALSRSQMSPTFEQAAFHQPLGQVGEPVVTADGVQLLKVERRTADSAVIRRILIPIARAGARLDTLEARADSLDRLAAEQTDPTTLDSVSREMSLDINHAAPLYQGNPLILGIYRVPDAGVWAFESKVGELSPVIETTGAFYVFRLDSLVPAGVPPLSAIMPLVRFQVLEQKKREAAEAIAADAQRRLEGGSTLEQVSQAMHLPIQTIGPFTITSTVPVLGTATVAVGAAFRLRVGERSGLLSSPYGYFFLEPTRRVRADSAAWLKQRDSERVNIIQAARQVRVQSFLASLRRNATVVDNRAAVLKPTQSDQ